MITTHREPDETPEPSKEQLYGVHISLEGGEEDTTERPSTVLSRYDAAAVQAKNSEHLDRARRYHAAIHDILLKVWDPIGIADVPEAQDEYDSYVAEVYVLLIRREPRHKVLDYLWWAETEHMSLRGNRGRAEQVVDRLLALRQELEGG
jgi:hypothetical protein